MPNGGDIMDDVSAIRATAAPWCEAGIDRNWDALLAMCTSDVVFAPPGEPSVSGSKLKPWLEAFPVMKDFRFSFDGIEVSGDLATGVGRGAWTLDINGQDVSATFKFADVFKRSPQGWRYAHVIWNLDAPGA
jgi:ketosteroid isomerase-like protein